MVFVALFLVGVNSIKIMFALLHMLISKWDRCCVRCHKRKLHSDVFKRLIEDQETGKEAAFVVYYDFIRTGSKMRISTSDDPEYLQSNIRSSVNDGKVYRGFNKKDIKRKQKISDGRKKCKHFWYISISEYLDKLCLFASIWIFNLLIKLFSI